jgi:uncharacterized repeat protein (TIGR02543 family)
VFNDPDEPDSNKTTYSITYYGNGNDGGSVPIDNNSYEQGDTVIIKDNIGNLIKTNYLFSGWSNSSGTVFHSNDSLTISGSDVQLYAKWGLLSSLAVTVNYRQFDTASFTADIDIQNNSEYYIQHLTIVIKIVVINSTEYFTTFEASVTMDLNDIVNLPNIDIFYDDFGLTEGDVHSIYIEEIRYISPDYPDERVSDFNHPGMIYPSLDF